MSDAHIYRPAPRTDPALRLFCYPYAGAGAAIFRLWPRHLPEGVEVVSVHPPARAQRLREPPLTSIDEMVEVSLALLEPLMDKPFALFGHSLGAVLAGEAARKLQARGRPPAHLFVSARPPRRDDPDAQIHGLPDQAFVAAVNRRYQGIPEEILQHPDVLALVLPALRADLQALETFRPDPTLGKIACATTVFGGALDRAVTRTDLESWRDEVAGPCRIRVFPGDHFYIEPQRANLVGEIAATLAPLLDGPARAEAAI